MTDYIVFPKIGNFFKNKNFCFFIVLDQQTENLKKHPLAYAL